MSDTMEQTVFYKIRYTPMRDFLRGQITARMDLRRPLEEASLAPSIKQLIQRVVSRTRLWRLEKLDVMHELIDHFTQGIASGASPEQLIKAFGDESQAATLIRRSKRRNRPLPWQVLRIACWPMAALLVFYLGFAVYFFAGQPSPRVNYVAIINQAIEKTPLKERAWPMYRRALLGLGAVQRQPASSLPFEAQPGWKQWPQLLEFVKHHPSELEAIREGASRPALGFVFGAGGSAYDAELWPPEQKPPVIDPVAGQELTTVRLPSLWSLRAITAVLAADATLAREAHDGKRLLRDMNSILGLSKQVGENAPLLCELVSLSIYDAALDQIERTLREDPALIESKDWMTLANRLSAPKVAGDLITIEWERMWFDDMLQRSFTDDGSGNGRVTPQSTFLPQPKNIWLKKVVKPAEGLLSTSRQRLAKEYTQLSDRAAANLKLPLRDTDWRNFQDDLKQSRMSIRGLISLNAALISMPDYQRLQETAERYLGRRDGLVAGIALEVFRREHGKYPEDLNVLVPRLLPDVPADRITGNLVRYRLVDARPLVYSVGADRKDDGGRPTAKREAAANWDAKPVPMPDGDWLLYPTLK